MPNKKLKTLEIAGEPYDVGGVKGQQESNYRFGDVNLTPDNIAFLGADIVSSTTNDTHAFWKGKGTGYSYCSELRTNGQPSRYGMIYSTVYGVAIYQRFYGSDGMVAERYASAGTAMPNWSRPNVPTNTPYSTSNTEIANTQFVQEAINRRLTKSVLGGQIANFSLASGSATFKDFWTAPSNGVAVITVNANFAPNGTGSRALACYIRTSAGATPLGSNGVVESNPGGSYGPILNVSNVLKVSANNVLTARFVQNSGSALDITNAYWKVLFIPD